MKRFLTLGLTLILLVSINPISDRFVLEVEAKSDVDPAVVQQQPCGCNDVADMLSRIEKAYVAIFEYTNRQKHYAGKNFDFSEYNQIIQPLVDEIMFQKQKPGINAAKGSTHAATCELLPITTPKGMILTPCLKAGIEAHEKVHQDVCEIWKKNAGTFRGLDYRSKMSMHDVLEEEKNGYMTEIYFFREQIKNLPQNCKPPGWVGNVTYESVEKIAKTEVVPPDKSGIRLGGQTVYDYEKKHTANITVVAGETFVEQIYTLTNKKDGKYTRMTKCGSSIREEPFAHTITNNETTKMNVKGFGKTVSFNISPDGNDGYRISFRAPRVLGGTSEITSTWSPPPCGQPHTTTPALTAPFNLENELSYTIKAKGKPNDLVLKGSEIIPMPGGFWTIKVSWDLSRGKAADPNVSILQPTKTLRQSKRLG